MKPKLPLLALSLTANAALLAFLLLRSPAPAPRPAPVVAPSLPAASASVSATGPLALADAAALARACKVLAMGDLPTLVARLRAAGFSPSDTRAIVAARLSQIYGAKRAAAVAQQEVVPYWRSSQTFPEDPKAGALITGLIREQAAQLKQLLGTDADPDDAWSKLIQQRQYGYLPADKVDRLQAILTDYNDMQASFAREGRGLWLPEDQAKQALLEKEKEADLALLFTPDELEAYQLHNSQAAYQLRYQLQSFKPTEEEFRALYRMTGDKNLFYQRPMPPEQAQQLEAVLGPTRAAEFMETTDGTYQQTGRLVARLELPAETVPKVTALQRDFQQRIQALNNDRTLSPDARQNALTALAAEADTQFPLLLGDRGYKMYRSSIGSWVNNLKPQPGTAPVFGGGATPEGTIIHQKPQPVFPRAGGN